ncbi:MAG: hypothetical protein ABFS02_01850 [Pseudomonadota bacterium]
MVETGAMTHLMVALPCEAKPLVAHYGLKRLLRVKPFSIYENRGVRLTVTGIGKTAMAAATAYTQALFNPPAASVWLNVGVAGRAASGLGESFVAEKITDGDTGRSWYPPLIIDFPCNSAEVRTVSKAEDVYAGECLYEMESSGFYETACRFATSELVHCLKVVSDNAVSPATAIERRQVERWIRDKLSLIDEVRVRLAEAALMVAEEVCPAYSAFASHWRFTSQQRVLLRQLLWRWQVLEPMGVPTPLCLVGIKSASEVLKWLDERVGRLPVTLP